MVNYTYFLNYSQNYYTPPVCPSVADVTAWCAGVHVSPTFDFIRACVVGLAFTYAANFYVDKNHADAKWYGFMYDSIAIIRVLLMGCIFAALTWGIR